MYYDFDSRQIEWCWLRKLLILERYSDGKAYLEDLANSLNVKLREVFTQEYLAHKHRKKGWHIIAGVKQ